MEVVKTILIVCGGLLFLGGVIILLAAWFAPKLLATPFMQWMVTGRRLAPSRDNQTLMAVWSMLIGIYFVASLSGYTILSFIVFGIWLPFGVILLKRTFRPSDKEGISTPNAMP